VFLRLIRGSRRAVETRGSFGTNLAGKVELNGFDTDVGGTSSHDVWFFEVVLGSIFCIWFLTVVKVSMGGVIEDCWRAK